MISPARVVFKAVVKVAYVCDIEAGNVCSILLYLMCVEVSILMYCLLGFGVFSLFDARCL
jgi:hypothetical protein